MGCGTGREHGANARGAEASPAAAFSPLGAAVVNGAGTATQNPLGDSWTVVLQRQPAQLMQGRVEGGYTDVYELI